MDTNKIFEALPHVNEIWVTKDGHFHLHPNNGGKKTTREPEAKPLTAEEIIALIDAATTKEEVITLLGEDQRVSVKGAAEKKIASFDL